MRTQQKGLRKWFIKHIADTKVWCSNSEYKKGNVLIQKKGCTKGMFLYKYHKKLTNKMTNFNIELLANKDPDLCDKLRKWCYELNGCCLEVHRELGPFLNEYMYQDALEIILEERKIKPFTREYYFSVDFHGKRIHHKHFVDFYVKEKAFIECKAAEKLCSDHRQQLWNYMRLTKTRIGILWNFAPVRDQSEHYYLDVETNTMYMF